VATDYSNAKWPMVELGVVCDLESGSRQKGGAVDRGIYSIGGEQISSDNIIRFEKMKYITENHFLEMKKGILQKDDVLMVKDGATTGKMGYWGFDYRAAVNEHVFIFRAKEKILSRYLFSILLSDSFQYELKPYIKGIIGGISLEIKKIKIPLPPLEIQEQIVAELDAYQNIITGAKQIVANWRPEFIQDSNWPIRKLSEIADFQEGPGIMAVDFKKEGVPLIRLKCLNDNFATLEGCNFLDKTKVENKWKHFKLEAGDLLLSTSGSLGRVSEVGKNIVGCIAYTGIIRFRPRNNEIYSSFLKYFLMSEYFINQAVTASTGVTLKHFGPTHLNKMEIAVPPIAIQKQIVEKIEGERVLIEAAKKLIGIYEGKIKEVVGKLWRE
jgi:restriction endonuclease S subunit